MACIFLSPTLSLPQQALVVKGGIGLANVRRRLDLLFPNLYKLEINDKDNSFDVHLHIQLEAYEMYHR